MFENAGKLVAPTVIPKQVQILKEEPIPDVVGGAGVPGGVPGGVAGGTMGGVLGGVIRGTGAVPLLVAPKATGPQNAGARRRARKRAPADYARGSDEPVPVQLNVTVQFRLGS